MPKNDVTVSEKAPEELQSDFVLDFMYNDARRVGSFLSQFDESGLLDKVIQRESATKGQKRGLKVQFSGGASILGTGGNAGIGIDRSPIDSGSEAMERQYDPLWSNALTLLDFLSASHLIKNDITKAGIGQFVRISGQLEVHDLAGLKSIWELPAVRRQLGFNQSKGRKDPAIEGLEVGLELVKVLPHSITARMRTRGLIQAETWSTLAPEFMTGSTSDLFLKHGAKIAGTWTMIGVLDAGRDLILPTEYTEDQNNLLFATNGLSHFLDLIGPIARAFLGRPSGAFGVTPLVIYREVSR